MDLFINLLLTAYALLPFLIVLDEYSPSVGSAFSPERSVVWDLLHIVKWLTAFFAGISTLIIILLHIWR